MKKLKKEMCFSLCKILVYCGVWSVVMGSMYHEASRTILRPSEPADYFGYSILFRDASPPLLVVSAPTAPSTHMAHAGLGNTGAVYSCSLDLKPKSSNITCNSIEFDSEGNGPAGGSSQVYHYKNEMWLGGSMVDINNGTLVICAPRWANQVMNWRSPHRLVNGLCYIVTARSVGLMLPLGDMNRQAYVVQGERPEYGTKGTVLNFFAYGQAGFSSKVSLDGTWLLLGAPGLLQWTGGIAKYNLAPGASGTFFGKQPTTNPYFTPELAPDSYFGYSVDAGIFETDGVTLGVGGAPRGHGGYGQVLLFELTRGSENVPMRLKANLFGYQLGEYFGSVLLVVDINCDGRDDLLVGAPLHADRNEDKMPYDQGIVYVYLNRPSKHGFMLELVGKLTGSGSSGARFGSSIANLGDVDGGDSLKYPEIAIGAPWESEGLGAVYIYESGPKGVNKRYSQKIAPKEYRGFGISIARGIDIDGNGCNELAVGAYDTGAVVIYRCIRTMHATAVLKVPEALDLSEDAKNFTAYFCVSVRESGLPNKTKDGKLNMNVVLSLAVDLGGNRATLSGDSEFVMNVEEGNMYCKEEIIIIHPHADLSRPLTLKIDLKPEPNDPLEGDVFHSNIARLGLNAPSKLSSSRDVQLTRNCGPDLICQPDYQIDFTSLSTPFVPGSGERLGAEMMIQNIGEPAYRSCVKVSIPTPPLRVPSNCRLSDMLLTCDLPRPFYKEEARWPIELDDGLVTIAEHDLVMNASIYSSCDDVNAVMEREFLIHVEPQMNITALGRSLPNSTVSISREKFTEGANFDFGHFFAISNFGPSDMTLLEVDFDISPMVQLVDLMQGCAQNDTRVRCSWSLNAHEQHAAVLQLRFKPLDYSTQLEGDGAMNITTTAYIKHDNITVQVSSTLTLDPAPPVWPIVVAVLIGLLLVAVMVFGLHKVGFFGRALREKMDHLKADFYDKATPGSMQDILINKSDDLDDDEHSREPSPLSDFYAVE